MVLPRIGNEVEPLSTTSREQRQSVPTSLTTPIELISHGMLCRLRIWNDGEWAQLADDAKPRDFARVPGLGWVGAVPVAGLN